jgi:hypothetical protein
MEVQDTMSFTPQAPMLTPPLTGIVYRIVQSLKAGTPKVAAFKYELYHGIYPMLADAVLQQSQDSARAKFEKVVLRQRLTYGKTKARLVNVYLSLINMDLLAEDSALDASECDAILVDEFGEAGEELVRSMMLHAAEMLLTEPAIAISQDEIATVREQQRRVVTSLTELQSTPTRLLNGLPQAESLIERFWYHEEQLA